MVLNSWCERLSIFSLLLVISIFIIDLNLNLLPIHGLWLCLYVSLLIISTIWIICVDIQKLLQKTSPFEYDFYSNSHYKKWLHLYEVIQQRVIGICCIQQEGQTPTIENRTILLEAPDGLKKSSIDERIELFVNDIQQRFLSKWYQMISEDPNFPHESKILLEGVIRRVLQVSVQLDGSQIVHGVIVILLKHLKEFRRSLKRLKKNGAGSSVEQVYRYSHIGNKSELAMEHFCHQLTANVLREFISWELLNSLPCRLFVSILSKRLTSYIIHYISQPGWINYKLLSELANEQDIISLKLDQFQFISLSDIHLSDDKGTTTSTTTTTTIELKEVKNPENSSTPKMSPKRETSHNDHNDDDKVEQNVIENALTQLITQHTASILQRAEKTDNEFQPKRSEPVKIHSGKSTINRWDETELTNLSVGQDLLELDDLEDPGIEHFSGRRLWGAYNPEQDEKVDLVDPDLVVANREGMTRFEQKLSKRISPPALSSSIPHCLRPATTSASALYTNTIKPIAGNVTATTLHNMRELQQSTVNNVVKPVSHVTEKAIHKIGDLQDEAVGVVEGIFDFGMAGIRKGLRLTGLQDQEGKNNVPKLVKVGHVVSEEVKVKGIEDESCWMNPIAMMKEESPNGFENQILLEKSPNISETTTSDSTLLFTDSPEYEETADLASTIDKLRSLLQQKSSNSSLNTPAVSPMPLDDIVRAPIIEQDRGMQRFARTVTGMFNTFKTALPGNSEQVQAKEEKWLFIENETTDTDLPSLLNCLLVERRDYCTIDTAYEAMDSLDLLTESISSSNISKIHWENQRFVPDEPDDFDSQIPITKALVDLVCECLQDTNCALTQEPVIQALLLVAGTKTEQKLSEFAAKLIRITNRFIGPLPKQFNDDVLALSSEKMITMIEKTLPYYIQEIFGHEDLTTALKFFITSLQSMKINQDVVLQVFELVCSQLIYTSGQHSPTPSA